MDRELQERKMEENRSEADRLLSTILYFTLAGILFFLVDLYMIIAWPKLLPAIVIAGVAVLACIYLALATMVKRTRMKEADQTEQIASILKSEKASYLLIRKYFDEIEEQMSLLEDRLTEPFQEIVAAQKATAKAVINRNKENTGAVLNANERLMDVLTQVDGRVEELVGVAADLAAAPKENASELLEKQTELLRQSTSDIVAEQADDMLQELSEKLRKMDAELKKELKEELKNELLQAVEKLSALPPQVVMAAPQPQVQAAAAAPVMPELGVLDALEDAPLTEAVVQPKQERSANRASDEAALDHLLSGALGGGLAQPAAEAVPTDAGMKAMSAPEPLLSELQGEPMFELEEETLEDLPELEPLAELEDALEPTLEMQETSELGALDFDQLDQVDTLEDDLEPLPDLFTEVTLDAPLPAPGQEPVTLAEEPFAAQEMDEPEPFAPQEEAEETSVEELPPMPDLSDLNKMMTPDDIAALLANMNPEPEIVADEIVEEQPQDSSAPLETEIVDELSMPDDSFDPNKIMSPDDIAAILASVNAEAEALQAEPQIVADEVVEEDPLDALAPLETEIVKDVPPMPDLSDPNKMMSPDDIAALFANLG